MAEFYLTSNTGADTMLVDRIRGVTRGRVVALLGVVREWDTHGRVVVLLGVVRGWKVTL